MMNRYSVRKGMYNLFSSKISVNDWSDIASIVHEFCHHIHNFSSDIFAERFQLFLRIYGGMIDIIDCQDTLNLPFNAWQENNAETAGELYKKLSSLLDIQKEWEQTDKTNYQPKHIDSLDAEHLNENIIIVKSGSSSSETLYLIIDDTGKAYPVGLYHLMESAAFSLEQIVSLNNENTLDLYISIHPEYVILISYVLKFIPEFASACLYTFLLCDLCLCCHNPLKALEFLLINFTLPDEDTVDGYFRWYEEWYTKLGIEQNYCFNSELVQKLKTGIAGMNEVYRLMYDYQIRMMENGIKFIKLSNRVQLLLLLITAKEKKDIDKLIHLLPTTIFEVNSETWTIVDEEFATVYDFLAGINNLYLGLCRNFNVILNDIEIAKHFKQLSQDVYEVNVSQEGGETNVYGFLFMVMGLNGKRINILPINAPNVINHTHKIHVTSR